ncbi:MAG: glycosyltransferase, partial [Ignavibacteriales bacterium]
PSADPPRLVAVGRLHPVKGFDVLIDAFALVRQAHPDARLSIVGDGEQREPLRRQIAARGLEGAVDMPGALTPDAVRERLHAAGLFVLPSLSEGMSLALLEAMACGLPVVASAVGGVNEVVRPDVGILVPPHDPRALADAILQAVDDEARLRSMGAAARRRAEALSWDEADAAYETLFTGLAA